MCSISNLHTYDHWSSTLFMYNILWNKNKKLQLKPTYPPYSSSSAQVWWSSWILSSPISTSPLLLCHCNYLASHWETEATLMIEMIIFVMIPMIIFVMMAMAIIVIIMKIPSLGKSWVVRLIWKGIFKAYKKLHIVCITIWLLCAMCCVMCSGSKSTLEVLSSQPPPPRPTQNN